MIPMKEGRSFEAKARSPENLIEFYRNVFGWDVIIPNQTGDGWLIRYREDASYEPLVAVEEQSEDNEVPRRVTTAFFTVDDIDETIGKVTANGGKMLFDAEDKNCFWRYCTDPADNGFIAIQHKELYGA